MEMTDERFALIRQAIFCALCDLAVKGLRNWPAIELPKLPRIPTITGRHTDGTSTSLSCVTSEGTDCIYPPSSTLQ